MNKLFSLRRRFLFAIAVRGIVIASMVALMCAAGAYAQAPSCLSVGPLNTLTYATSGFKEVYAYGVQNATSVSFATWSLLDGQDDIVWYAGENMGNGVWKGLVNLAAHRVGDPDYGQIAVQVYLYFGATSSFCGDASFLRQASGMPVSGGVAPYGTTTSGSPNTLLDFFAYSVQNSEVVVFPTWSDANWQDDITWYVGKKMGSGTWKGTVSLANHQPGNPKYGNINVQIYGYNGAYGYGPIFGSTPFTWIAPAPAQPPYPGGTLLLPDLPNGTLNADNIHTWNPVGGAVNNYHVPAIRSQVDNFLQATYNEGQRRIRIMLWHKRGGSVPCISFSGCLTGTVIDSTGGDFPQVTKTNLLDILQKVKTIGYQEVLVVFGPEGHNYVGPWDDREKASNPNAPLYDLDLDGIATRTFTVPPSCELLYYPPDNSYDLDTHTGVCHDLWRGIASTWSEVNQGYFLENWGVISNIYPLVTSVPGLTVKVDLGNEYTVSMDPTTNETNPYESGFEYSLLHHKKWGLRAKYMRDIWQNFINAFGTGAATMGFSLQTGGNVLDTVKGVYQIYDIVGFRPYVVLAHFYGAIDTSTPGALFFNLDAALHTVGEHNTGVAIGEVYYNDSFTASELRSKMISTGRRIWYLMQFPITRPIPPCPVGAGCFVDFGGQAPLFSNYRAYGF